MTELGITLLSVAPPVDDYVGGQGDTGSHADRSRLPSDIAVEIEMTARVRD